MTSALDKNVTIVPGTGSLSLEGGDVVAAVGTVVSGRDLRETQTASAAAVVYVETPHFLLGEADFNRLVDPPPRYLQWLPTVRGAWLAAAIVSAPPIIDALVQGQAVLFSLIPTTPRYGLVIATIIWLVLEAVVRIRRNPRDETIKKIRKTFQQSTDLLGK